MDCGIIFLKEQISSGVEKGFATLCSPSVKKTVLVAVSLFAMLASGVLVLLSASVLFSGTASVLPYFLMLTTALFGFVCAIIVLMKNISEVIRKCKKVSVKEPEPKQPHDGQYLEIGVSKQSSPTCSIEGVLRSIGDDICNAVRKDGRPRSCSC